MGRVACWPVEKRYDHFADLVMLHDGKVIASILWARGWVWCSRFANSIECPPSFLQRGHLFIITWTRWVLCNDNGIVPLFGKTTCIDNDISKQWPFSFMADCNVRRAAWVRDQVRLRFWQFTVCFEPLKTSRISTQKSPLEPPQDCELWVRDLGLFTRCNGNEVCWNSGIARLLV